MNRKNPTAFVSYSWDSKEHQQWVLNLTNQLRTKGIDASMDVFETQKQTVNLNRMMITKVKDSDYIVIVLTEAYAQKADANAGGVGFETLLTLPYVRDNLGKLILIMRHQGDYSKVFPFHLNGVYAIDFSDDNDFDDKLEELIYKIYNAPLYEMAPLGDMLDLKPRNIGKNNMDAGDRKIKIDKTLIPNSRKITDIDKKRYIEQSYNKIISIIKELLDTTKNYYPNIDYTLDEITKTKSVIHIYLNGERATGIKIWYGSSMGMRDTSIYASYDRWHGDNNDNSSNEMITCEVTDDNELKLKMTMNMFGNRGICTAEDVAKEIWISHLKIYLES